MISSISSFSFFENPHRTWSMVRPCAGFLFAEVYDTAVISATKRTLLASLGYRKIPYNIVGREHSCDGNGGFLRWRPLWHVSRWARIK